MSLYEVGDKVTIREDLFEDGQYGSDNVCDDMLQLCGKTVTIEETNVFGFEDKYRIAEYGYNWTDDMFVETEQKRKEMLSMEGKEMVQFPELNIPEMDDTEYIERSIPLEEELYDRYSCRDEDYINYPYTHKNVRKAIEYSNKKKAKLNALFSRHQNWDAKTHSIVFDAELYRCVNRDEVYTFFAWIKNKYYNSIPEAKSEDGKTVEDIAVEAKRYQRICDAYECLYSDERDESNICDITYADALRSRDEQKAIYFSLKEDNILTDVYPSKWISKKENKVYKSLYKFLDIIYSGENCQQFINEEVSEAAKVFEDETEIKLNAVVGRKMSRMINTLCTALNLTNIKGDEFTTL